MSVAERRSRFLALHDELFVMPNPWDAGSARLLAAAGFPALATTSSGLALALGRLDQTVTRDELVAHTADLAAATSLPLNVDAERGYPDDPGGITQTVRLLAAAGAAGLSVEDYDPVAGRIEDAGVAARRVAAAAEAAHAGDVPLVLTARAENLLYGVHDLEDTISRLVAYRDAGADVVYAPGLRDAHDIGRVAAAVGAPLNVLALPGCPPVPQLAALGVRRVSTGGVLARVAYGALVRAAAELRSTGDERYAAGALSGETLRSAL